MEEADKAAVRTAIRGLAGNGMILYLVGGVSPLAIGEMQAAGWTTGGILPCVAVLAAAAACMVAMWLKATVIRRIAVKAHQGSLRAVMKELSADRAAEWPSRLVHVTAPGRKRPGFSLGGPNHDPRDFTVQSLLRS